MTCQVEEENTALKKHIEELELIIENLREQVREMMADAKEE